MNPTYLNNKTSGYNFSMQVQSVSNSAYLLWLKYCIASLIFLLSFASCTKREKVFNQPASEIDTNILGSNPLMENVITSFVNLKHGTMSTLYGNNIAFNHAGSNGSPQYPVNAVLYMVTWKQVPDPRWFGANIPGNIVSVEIVKFNKNSENKIDPVYSCYTGQLLKLTNNIENYNQRIAFITNEKMSVIP
jgi:hypothetical protein